MSDSNDTMNDDDNDEKPLVTLSNSNEDDEDDVGLNEEEEDVGDEDDGKPMTLAISLEQMSPYFEMPLQKAASKMNISSSTLNRSARALGLAAWPYRRVCRKIDFLTSKPHH